jgi:hypothetical protein
MFADVMNIPGHGKRLSKPCSASLTLRVSRWPHFYRVLGIGWTDVKPQYDSLKRRHFPYVERLTLVILDDDSVWRP